MNLNFAANTLLTLPSAAFGAAATLSCLSETNARCYDRAPPPQGDCTRMFCRNQMLEEQLKALRVAEPTYLRVSDKNLHLFNCP